MSKLLLKYSWAFFIVGILIIILIGFPLASYLFEKNFSIYTSKILAQTISKDQAVAITKQEVKKSSYQPKFDSTLPSENRLIITTIGVDTELQEAGSENFEEALKKGVWRVPDFGNPYDRERPTILAAHRYGYLAWSNSFRRQNSFYNLPKLSVGSTLEIIWNQRRYKFIIYSEDKGEEIKDYSADLILYTCENLNSPVRIFKYARLLEI